jgi:hypothetical protein
VGKSSEFMVVNFIVTLLLLLHTNLSLLGHEIALYYILTKSSSRDVRLVIYIYPFISAFNLGLCYNVILAKSSFYT